MIIWFFQTFSMLIPLDEIISYLAAHPILLLLLVLFLVGMILSLLKKVLKTALIFLLLFVAANAVMLYFADTEWARKGKKMLDEGRRKAGQFIDTTAPALLREGERAVKSLSDSTVPTPAKKLKRK